MIGHYERRERSAKWLLVYAGCVTLVWVIIEAIKPVEVTARLAFGSVIGACVAISRSLWITANEGLPPREQPEPTAIESATYRVTQERENRSLPG